MGFQTRKPTRSGCVLRTTTTGVFTRRCFVTILSPSRSPFVFSRVLFPSLFSADPSWLTPSISIEVALFVFDLVTIVYFLLFFVFVYPHLDVIALLLAQSSVGWYLLFVALCVFDLITTVVWLSSFFCFRFFSLGRDHSLARSELSRLIRSRSSFCGRLRHHGSFSSFVLLFSFLLAWPVSLSRTVRAQLADVFENLDHTADGFIRKEDIRRALDKLDIVASDAQIT